jgi:hypothetical protein
LCLYGIGFSAGEGTADHARSPALGLEIELFNNAERDAVFLASFGNDLTRLNELAHRWERLDATFVGLCVEHVLKDQYRARVHQGPLV